MGALAAVPEVLRRFDVDPAEILDEFGIDAAYFTHPENLLPMATVGRILGRCSLRTQCDHFGLLVGEQANAASLGPLGYLGLSAATVGAALQAMTHHLELLDRGTIVVMAREGRFVRLTCAVVGSAVEHYDQVLAGVCAILCNVMRGLCGAEWRPDEVHFAFAAPRSSHAYRRFFGVKPRFDAELTALVFRDQVLDRPIATADLVLHRLMEERIRETEFRAFDDVAERVRRLLRVVVTSPEQSLTAVANRLGMHARTLNRELAASGTTFLALREEVRFEVACQLLRNTRAPVGEIASVLRYTDPSSFTRAFQRWSGLGPLRWRTRQRQRRLQGA